MAHLLELRGLTKKFSRVIANDNISFKVDQGEVHAILGENGAGKSTLMSCLYGLYTPDSGEIFFKGKKVNILSSEDAIQLGIGMVHQHFMLIPQLTVVENIILGLKLPKDPWLDLDYAAKEIQALSDQYHFNIDPFTKVKDLPVGMQQKVEILKVLYRKPELLIFDEPTAVLTPGEVEEFFKVIDQLTSEGKTIVFITHKLNEVMSISNRITVLRDGRVGGSAETVKTNEEELAKMMVGREVFLNVPKAEAKVGNPVLDVDNITVKNSLGIEMVKGISFEVREGEILGIAGVDGNGQAELSEGIAGLLPIINGKVEIQGKNTTNWKPNQLLLEGVSHIPPDRHLMGLVLDFSIKENMVIKEFSMNPFAKNGVIQSKPIEEHSEKLIKEYEIKATDANVLVKKLSGGNQQKVILARELQRNPKLIIAVQPTRGLDIGAIEFVRHKLIEQRDSGAAILLISTELEEVMALSDRIAVMYEGEFTGIVDAKEADIMQIGLMMAGKKKLDTRGQEVE